MPRTPLTNLLKLSGELQFVVAPQKSLPFPEASLLSEGLLPHSGTQRAGTQGTMFLREMSLSLTAWEKWPISLGNLNSLGNHWLMLDYRKKKKKKQPLQVFLYRLCNVLKYLKKLPWLNTAA